jgi:dienelactone hydrolase
MRQVEELAQRRKTLPSSPEGLKARSNAFRRYLVEILGYMPPRNTDLSPVKKEEVALAEGVVQELVAYEVEPDRPMAAHVCRPSGATGRLPGILVLHAWDLDKSSIDRAKADLVRSGYVVLLPGHRCSREPGLRDDAGESCQYVGDERTVMGMITFENTRALDYLCSREDVDPERVACIGMCWSGIQSYLLAAMDERVKVACPVCGLSMHGAMATHNTFVGGHTCIDTFIPGLLQVAQVQDIMALIAPRPLLLQNNVSKAWAPILGFDKVEADLSAVYRALGYPDRFQAWTKYSELDLTPEFIQRIIEWLDRFFRPAD